MKNPWMSMWLSGANAWAGAARGVAGAELRRQQSAMATEATRQMMALWFPAAKAAVAPKPARRRKTRRG